MPAIHRTRETAALVADRLGVDPVPVAAVLALGITRGQLRAALDAQTLRRPRRGMVQVPMRESIAAESRDSFALDRHKVLAVLSGLDATTRLSHGSAGQLWGLPQPRPGPPDPDVWVTAAGRHGVVHRDTHLRIGSLEHEDCAEVDGIRCTSLARTAVDMARFRPLPESLVVLDAALRRVSRSELWAALDRHPLRYGRRGLREAILAADARAESPLESASRGVMLVAGIPLPELQKTLWVEGSAVRLDFYWDEQKVAGEADGWGKLRTADDLRAEKIREDGVRRRGITVVRWTSDEIWRRPNLVVSRIKDALTP